MEINITENRSISSSIQIFYSSVNNKVVVVQGLIGLLLCVNSLMIFTFIRQEVFRTDTRYILFAQMLFLDSTLMLMTDLAVLGAYFQYPLTSILCVILCVFMDGFTYGTPLTLVVMCLERYVAICLPLRHADISNPKTRLIGLLLVWLFSFIPSLTELFALLSVAPFSFWFSSAVCNFDVMNLSSWHSLLRTGISQLYFLVLSAITTFTYIKIVVAARLASAESKKSASKCLRTVILHAFQLVLCFIQFWCPFIESAVMKIDITLFVNVRYSNFVLFLILPRCLSSLIYGLRDAKFFLALKYNFFFGMNKNICPVLDQGTSNSNANTCT
nr:somatostatin receptor type 5-like [Paramormyrops kingsleyae]